MDLYHQDAELALLSKLLTRLENRTMIDVGAEQGAMSAGMLAAGVEKLHAIEPHPTNADTLRARFAGDARVAIHELAISDSDGDGELHVSSHPDGRLLPFGHTLLQPADTGEIAWNESVTVTRRSLESLLNSGAIPDRVGVLKIDTEGHDMAVVRGMGRLLADIVMVEHWTDLPNGLGVCPWTTLEMVEALSTRGFTHFAFIVHRDDFVTLRWDDGDVEAGAMGNLVFVHDSMLDRLLPDLLACAGSLADRAVGVGQGYMRVASDRLALVGELEKVAEDRLALVHELEEIAEARLKKLETTTGHLRDKNAELDALRLQHSGDSVS
jgi:FkbM family methyltransferase